MRLTFILLILATAVGCGGKEEPGMGTSGLHYITFGPGVTGLVGKVKKRNLTVCLSGHTSADRALWVENIQSSILKWIEPLRKLTSDTLAREVAVVDGRGNCDTDVAIAPNTHSNTSIGGYPIVRMSPTGYFASYNVLLHEFGHAFALSDTYQNGASGNCKPGQPQAVMCNTSFSALQSDDVSGVQEVFKKAFPRDEPNTGGGTVTPDPLNVRVSLALGKSDGTDAYELIAGLSGQDASATSTLAYCLRNCDQETSWKRMQFSQSRPGSHLFSAGRQKLVDGMTFQVRVLSGPKEKNESFEFRAI